MTFQWVSGLKRPNREPDYSLFSNVQYAWSLTWNLPYVVGRGTQLHGQFCF
jgi:hypothetical protein